MRGCIIKSTTKKHLQINCKCLKFMVGMTRIELATPCSRSRGATRLRYIPKSVFCSTGMGFLSRGKTEGETGVEVLKVED